ncbi:uncharacterized protein THITE_2116677 [Thermothielavioides terrestris NRRL 8126]|uniref:Uncharacterized protein n=1 Tax=Thermothielavioides terrestris (strain ATCC 38088 / NRRL 8126) TaxID=578455 RepID=G2R6Z7_THETT|nr:uncharacterized protein THITE_2116677 [Thermothielavioides terrestris NRRL 8126]AEO67725.1 hypothetical protein THITE_2116677 [Thermothielavioides terrestris NRRL 8126]
MFGGIAFMIPGPGSLTNGPPKDVPPPTPINLPRCCPQVSDRDGPGVQGPASGKPPAALTSVLQGIVRPTDVAISHLEALRTHVIPDAAPSQIIPDPAFIPDFDAWHALSADDAHATNESTRRRLNTGNLSPGCQTYLERRRELSIPNEAAYRTIRRIPPPKGQPQARLGNAYEFYRHLELFTSFWEDTSKPPAKPEAKTGPSAGEGNGENGAASEGGKNPEESSGAPGFYRTGAGHQMPPDYRQNMVTAFLKLVTYDFTCNVSAPRTEPRLHITSRSSTGTPRSSYFTSGCTFIFRTPGTREAARAGIVEGPLAAVSARHTTSFPDPNSAERGSTPPGADRESTLDLARELVAALITAQHRAREGRVEKRIGENAWWCTKPRWGGGPGGPIGREVEMLSGADETIGDKDAPPSEAALPPQPSSSSLPRSPSSSSSMSLPQRPFSRPSALPIPGGDSGGSSKGAKRLKKSGNHPMYDNYRMVRPPAPTWDKKTRYEAIGRARGADYDDIFVVSTVLHHVSIVRVRVPDRLLAVLDGEPDNGRSWGRLEVWRSPWFDFFKVEERVQAMQLVWCMMAYMMREQPGKQQGAEGPKEEPARSQGDVKMTGA